MNESYCSLTEEDRQIIAGLKLAPPREDDQSEELRDRMGNKAGMVRALCCEECESEDVVCEGQTRWNAEQGLFAIAEVIDTYQSVYCNQCSLGGLNGKWVWRPRQTLLFGCTHCGCTDIEYQSWVELNTGIVTDDCGSSDIWCPQCEAESRCDEVDALKPYADPRSVQE